MYVLSLIYIPFVYSKIWPGQATNMKTWLRGDSSVNIQGTDCGYCARRFHSLVYIYIPSLLQYLSY